MRFILRLLMTLIGIVAFFAMAGSGAIYAYGQYGAPLVQDQLQKMEDQIEEQLEEEYPGAEVTVDIKEVFYKQEGGSVYVGFEVNAIAELANVEVENTTKYVVVDVFSVIMGNEDFVDYTEAEWDDVKDEFSGAPSILFDSEEAKRVGMTALIVSAALFVGSIVVKVVFLRKKIA